MIKGKRVVALIPARGGSKSIPLKNIKPLAGKPLIAYTIILAKKMQEIDRVIVSTDDQRIAEVARKYGAEVSIRPATLAEDDSLPIDVIRYHIKKLKEEKDPAEYMLYLEPTCPLRTEQDIAQSLILLTHPKRKYHSVATFSEAELNPHRAWKIVNNSPIPFIPEANPWLPRQKQPKALQLNGAVYAFQMDQIHDLSPHLLPEERGAVIIPRENGIDIDDELDFVIAEKIMERRITNAGL